MNEKFPHSHISYFLYSTIAMTTMIAAMSGTLHLSAGLGFSGVGGVSGSGVVSDGFGCVFVVVFSSVGMGVVVVVVLVVVFLVLELLPPPPPAADPPLLLPDDPDELSPAVPVMLPIAVSVFVAVTDGVLRACALTVYLHVVLDIVTVHE